MRRVSSLWWYRYGKGSSYLGSPHSSGRKSSNVLRTWEASMISVFVASSRPSSGTQITVCNYDYQTESTDTWNLLVTFHARCSSSLYSRYPVLKSVQLSSGNSSIGLGYTQLTQEFSLSFAHHCVPKSRPRIEKCLDAAFPSLRVLYQLLRLRLLKNGQKAPVNDSSVDEMSFRSKRCNQKSRSNLQCEVFLPWACSNS